MTLPAGSRYLGHAPSPATLAKGLRDGESAVRWPLGSCEIWAVPCDRFADLVQAEGADVAHRAPVAAAESEGVHPFGIPEALQERFREIIQDWRGSQIVEAFEAKGGKWRKQLNTGQMARVILGLDKPEVLNEDARADLRGACDVGDLPDVRGEGRGAVRSESSGAATRGAFAQAGKSAQKSEAGPGGLMVQGLLFE